MMFEFPYFLPEIYDRRSLDQSLKINYPIFEIKLVIPSESFCPVKKVVIFILVPFILTSCKPGAGSAMLRITGKTQGTYYAVTYYDRSGRNFNKEIDSILSAFDRSISLWDTNSIISRINRNDSTARVDSWFRDLFTLSQEISERTGGAFDATVGPLVNAWGFGSRVGKRPDSHAVDSLRALIGFRKVRLQGDRIFKQDSRIQLDFNAIAQGYSVDLISSFLEMHDVRCYLVDIGGEVFAKGVKPGHEPWMIGIENPARDSTSRPSINAQAVLNNMALSTSGSYRKYHEENGIRYSHTIDPATGFPIRHNLLSVSVLASRCAVADGYATALMVMGLEKAKEFLSKNPQLQAYFIYSMDDGTYRIFATPGFRKILAE
jgi:thiamine biosynthesis lipoprotein